MTHTKTLSLNSFRFVDYSRRRKVRHSMTSLSNSQSKATIGIDYVDVMQIMRSGCLMLNDATSPITKLSKWTTIILAPKNHAIYDCGTKKKLFNIKDVSIVRGCDDLCLENLYNNLSNGNNINISKDSLKCLTIEVILKNNKVLHFIVDGGTNAFLWYRGLNTLIKAYKPSHLKTLPLILSNRLRLGSTKIFDFLSSRKESSQEFFNKMKLEYIQLSKKIKSITSFINKSCVFGSNSHLALLEKSKILIKLLSKIEIIINNNSKNINEDEITELRELYKNIKCDLLVVELKLQHFKEDLKESIKSNEI